jgi:hypothetical protein
MLGWNERGNEYHPPVVTCTFVSHQTFTSEFPYQINLTNLPTCKPIPPEVPQQVNPLVATQIFAIADCS